MNTKPPKKLSKRSLEKALEAVLVLEHGVIRLSKLRSLFKDTAPAAVTAALEALNKRYREAGLTMHIQTLGETIELRLHAGFSHPIIEIYQKKKTRLPPALMETLAIIAYNQPVTKSDIQHIRGNPSSGALKSLITNKLIEVAGTKNAPGKPVLYKTTGYFLEFFAVKSVRELPPLRDLKTYSFLK